MGSLRRRTFLQSTAALGITSFAGCVGNGGEYGEAWLDVEHIRLGAAGNRWIGLAPDPIVDTHNPTLRLVYGRQYTVEWVNQDGEDHVFVVRNHEDDPIHESDERGEVDEEASLTFDAVAGVGYYTCPHFEVTMTGDIEIFEP